MMEYTQVISIAHAHGSDDTTSLSELVNQSDYTIIYFYPKDCTSGCTVEAVEFSQMVDEFAKIGAQIIGVSKDSLASHHKFITQSDLKVSLISDPDTSLHQAFGAWGEKSMYGRKYMGTVRSTFVLDKSARIITKYGKVTARGHATQVLKDLNEHIAGL